MLKGKTTCIEWVSAESVPRVGGSTNRMSNAYSPAAEDKTESSNSPRLEVDIYQLVDDSALKANRSDGSGWDWAWADWQRDWMNATPQRYAYRCLPLTIVNQAGWWIKNPVGFSATWRGGSNPGCIDFCFDVPDPGVAGLDQ